MSTGKIKRNLREALYSVGEGDQGAPSRLSCALSFDRTCCHGLGYHISTKGAFTVAEVCQCVKQCPICLGHTMIADDQSGMRPCRQLSPNRIVSVMNEAKLPAHYAYAEMAKFQNHSGNGQQIAQKLKSWLKDFTPHVSRGLVIGGPVGVGKTYLLSSLVKGLVARGISVKFIDFFQLLSEIRAGYSENKADLSILAPLLEVDVLAIDELGKGRNTEFELTILDQLVMGRYNSNGAIIASTNCSFQESRDQYQYNIPLDQESGRRGAFEPENFGSLESRVGRRIYSRLMETTYMLELTGNDFRRR